MRITRLRVANWRNFKNVEVALSDRVLIFGPNAAGKSNLLDALRFLRDLTVSPGGLQFAVEARGGVKRLRFLNARRNHHGQVLLEVDLGDDQSPARLKYSLSFTSDRLTGRPVVARETVLRDGHVLSDWDASDEDPTLRTQTRLEQVSTSREYRDLAEFLQGIEYLHLVPQVVRDPVRSGTTLRDPFGGTFLSEIGRAPKKDFERRRRIMESALRLAVPQFESLDRHQDRDGNWHLQAKYTNFRPNASAQDERDFSDGTLRLIGLLWVLSDRTPPLATVLLEEPELSLHADIVRQVPGILKAAATSAGRQIISSSHGNAMLDDSSLSAEDVVLLLPAVEGTTAKVASDDEWVARLVSSGDFLLSEALKADLVLPEISDLVSRVMT